MPEHTSVRRVMFVVVSDTIEMPQWLLATRTMPLSECLDKLLDAGVRGRPRHRDEQPAAFVCHDWSGVELPLDTVVAEVPPPGIVLAILKGRRRLKLLRQSSAANAGWLVRMGLQRDEGAADRLNRFLASPDAAAPAKPTRHIDVFVSYAFEDGRTATSLVSKMRGQGLEVFIAESSLGAGRQWREQLREALRSSRRAMLLVSPHSIQSPWVMAEAGALRWSGTPTLLALDGVGMPAVPPPLRAGFAHADVDDPDWIRRLLALSNEPEAAA